ncbi:MAG: glutathione S-transferase family protein [Pseudomonadota bacterium]
MPIVEPTNTEVKSYKGLHLYHSGVSNCSMRVRMTLEEKGQPWTSHHLNILKKEHITPEYFGINPNGLVPTLVHDGTVIIESDDIIDYLDDAFPEPPLKPTAGPPRDDMYHWLRRATAIHVQAVKTYIYFKRVGTKMSHSEEEDSKYRSLQKNETLLEFHRKSGSEGFSEDDVAAAKATLDQCFGEMDTILAEHDWLAGDAFSLADIAWVPLQVTLEKLAGYDFNKLSHVGAWTERLKQRSSYRDGVSKWWPSAMGEV